MILPIYVYGQDVLREKSVELEPSHKSLGELVQNMFDTMYAADGVGLSACQVGMPLRMFVCDVTDLYEGQTPSGDIGEGDPYRRVFINAKIEEFSGVEEPYKEGCLSLPGINENVVRPTVVRVKYFDENFVEHTHTFDGFWARVIQHEYDHTNGRLFSDHLVPIRKQMLRSKLLAMSKGSFSAKYRCV